MNEQQGYLQNAGQMGNRKQFGKRPLGSTTGSVCHRYFSLRVQPCDIFLCARLDYIILIELHKFFSYVQLIPTFINRR